MVTGNNYYTRCGYTYCMRAQPEGGTSTKGILHKHGLTIVACEPLLLSQQFALHCGVQEICCASVSIINTAVEGTVLPSAILWLPRLHKIVDVLYIFY